MWKGTRDWFDYVSPAAIVDHPKQQTAPPRLERHMGGERAVRPNWRERSCGAFNANAIGSAAVPGPRRRVMTMAGRPARCPRQGQAPAMGVSGVQRLSSRLSECVICSAATVKKAHVCMQRLTRPALRARSVAAELARVWRCTSGTARCLKRSAIGPTKDFPFGISIARVRCRH